jgi:hypothetical protein
MITSLKVTTVLLKIAQHEEKFRKKFEIKNYISLGKNHRDVIDSFAILLLMGCNQISIQQNSSNRRFLHDTVVAEDKQKKH